MNSRSIHRLLVVIAAIALLIAGFFIGTATISRTMAGNTFSAAPLPQRPLAQDAVPAQPQTEHERIYSDIYQRISPSVVSINVVARMAGNEFGFRGEEEGFAEGTGTGFVIDTQGHIVTNNHVVDGATRIEVNFVDGTITRGEIVGLDPDSDLAVIRVDLPQERLFPISFANSDELFIGQTTIAIGSPFNQPWTMTTGIISALDRTITGLTNYSIGKVIQTDAAINPGNSGGPLLDIQGRVIGVNSQIISRTRSSAGIGFAIPSNLVQRVADDLINRGDVEYTYLGISGDNVNLALMEALGLPNDTTGVVVQAVERGGPAATAGLRNAGGTTNVDGFPVPTEVDIITAIDGTPIRGMPALIAYLANYTRPGQTVNLTVLRDGRENFEVPVVLAERPEIR